MYRKLILHIISFFTGFSFMGYEILGNRILAPFFGSSVYTLGAVISVFLSGMSIGYTVGGRLADRRKRSGDLFYIYLCALIYLFTVSIYGKYICIYVSTLEINIRYSALLTSLILFFVPSILWGMILPYIIKMLKCSQENIASSVGNIYSTSTIGSIIGIIFVSFYMVNFVGTTGGLRILCIPLLVCSILAGCFKRKSKSEK